MTADPNDSRFVYAIWDRLRHPSDTANFNAQHAFSFRGDVMFSRTTDGGGETWEPDRAIFEPWSLQATIGHQIVVEPESEGGTLVDLFTHFRGSGNNRPGASLAMMRSDNHGATWSGPDVIHKIQFVGASIPTPACRSGPRALRPRWPSTEQRQPLRDLAGHPVLAFPTGSTRSPSRCRPTAATRSEPIKVSQTPPSADPANEQWVPAVDVDDSGTIAVTYYDFRFNTPVAGVPTDHWMVIGSLRRYHLYGGRRLAMSCGSRTPRSTSRSCPSPAGHSATSSASTRAWPARGTPSGRCLRSAPGTPTTGPTS